MTFFSSRVMPRLLPPAVDAIAIDNPPVDPVCPRWLRATFRNSSERGLKKRCQRGKKWQKAPPKGTATMGL
ncbi:hypothetical protein [Mesorhizobium sp. WSM3860]|uniref:hypothetical protein n=1 Tax=Mesorhizobium sp. WSM3860 TaxID=2029403 RepID=UPI00159676E9|nr:hypothetical protein [Mesorhizobium sp. WSM3860]